jgi:methionyl-tRNA formyltransferase
MQLSVRRAGFGDCALLFKWANDPLTRENAHNKEPIQYENHVAWLRNKLDSLDNWIFIVLGDNLPVALLRLDKKENDVLLTYSVAPESRGKGIGKEAISMLPEIIKKENIQCHRIIADVYKTNTASNKIFLSAGYHMKENGYLNVFKLDLRSPRTILIAATKPWNVKLAKEMESNSEDAKVHVITQRRELNLQLLEEIDPEYIFFPHWSWKISHEIFTKYCCIVFHMTDLPFGRGGSPLQNLIVKGIKETKITALQVTDEIDAGDIYVKFPLSLYGTAEEIYMRASKIVFHEMIPHILRECPIPRPQEGTITRFIRRTPEMSELQKYVTLEECFDYIRMLDADGYPPAFIRYGNLCISFCRPKLTSKGIVADVLIEEVM